MPNPKSKFPSTTTVLGAYSGFDAVRPDRLELACARGTAVHTACLAHAGNSFFFDIKPELQGYYDSFVLWFNTMVDTVIEVEPLWEDHKWGYCGSPDLLLILKGEQDISIWDLKTSKSSGKTWCGQLASYRNLALANGYDRIGRVGSLRLKLDGSMPLADVYEYSDRDFNAFLSALNAYRYFHG
jgi:hypothetical protein